MKVYKSVQMEYHVKVENVFCSFDKLLIANFHLMAKIMQIDLEHNLVDNTQFIQPIRQFGDVDERQIGFDPLNLII